MGWDGNPCWNLAMGLKTNLDARQVRRIMELQRMSALNNRQIKTLFSQFRRNEDGLALTEYLLLLGLITAGIITAVLGFGDSLSVLWTQWADFMRAFETAASVPSAGNLGL